MDSYKAMALNWLPRFFAQAIENKGNRKKKFGQVLQIRHSPLLERDILGAE